jgi:GT2 family glycosyltransferase
LLNNDASLFPNALEALHRTAFETDNRMILGLPQYDAATGSLIDFGTLLDPFFNPIPNKHRARTDVAMVIGACLWLPKHMWDEIGGFPEFFQSNAEDMYLCCCARLRGCRVAICPESGFRHRVGSSFGGGKVRRGVLSTTVRRRALSERNKSFALALTCPAPWLYAMLPLHLLLLTVEGLMLSAVKNDLDVWNRIYWPSLKALNGHRLELLRRRRIIQRARCISTAEFFSQFEMIPHKLRMFLRHGIPEIK